MKRKLINTGLNRKEIEALPPEEQEKCYVEGDEEEKVLTPTPKKNAKKKR